MQAELSILVLLVIAALVSGCAGAGQPDAGNGTIASPSNVVNASMGPYADEFNAGFGHHASASYLFNNATALWNEENYTAARELMDEARGEYALAEGHYHGMAAYAGDSDELAFAEAMEESVIDMDEAASRYVASIDRAMAGNDTESLQYFEEGQGFVDRSMMALNQSMGYMPSYLDRPAEMR